MIVDSHRLGAGEEAADIAAILTERGLGGDSVDLDARLDQFRRDRSPRAAQRAQPRAALGVAGGGRRKGAPGEDTSPSTGVMLALAFPDRVARNRGNGSFVLANGRGAAVDQTSSLARAPYIAVAELTGTAAQRPHPAGGADHASRDRAALRRPDRDRGRDFVRSRRDGAAGAPQADAARDHAVGSADGAAALGGDRAHARRRAGRRRARQAAMVESRRSNGATA